jgi:hypothetical protein
LARVERSLQFGNQIFDPPHCFIIGRLPCKRPVLCDLLLQLSAVAVFVSMAIQSLLDDSFSTTHPVSS